MEDQIREVIKESVRDFRLPRPEEIPDVGLYLDQVTKYISDRLRPLGNITITNSMVSNYVKQKLVPNPIKKRYDRVRIAYLLFIVLAKPVLSLEDIRLLLEMQARSYEDETAYLYFCREFENTLYYVFGLTDSLKDLGKEYTGEKTILRNMIITITHKIYLDKCLDAIRELKLEEETNKA